MPLTPKERRSIDAYPFHHRVRVRFAETDAMGVVHHAAYLPYLEEARVAWLDSVGRPYREQRDGGAEIAVVEVAARYLAPLRFDDVATIGLRLAEVRRATFAFEYLVIRGPEVCLLASTTHACLGPGGGPVAVPGWLAGLAV